MVEQSRSASDAAAVALRFALSGRLPASQQYHACVERADVLARGSLPVAGAVSSLISVFSKLSLNGFRAQEVRRVPVAPLSFADESVFSPAREVPAEAIHTQRAALAAELVSCGDSVEALLDLALRFGWSLPASGYGAETDVSLYAHARTTAAVAACLTSNTERFTLIGGDLSGIQPFIYTLASSGAAKSLRARSFYVQLLTEAMARWILREVNLPIVNALYIGGGAFQILTSALSSSAVEAIETSLQTRIFLAHRGALGVSLRGVEFGVTQFERFGAVRQELDSNLQSAKRQPFGRLSSDLLNILIGQPDEEEQGGDAEFCRVTGEELQPDEAVAPDDVPKSSFVRSLERLGSDLARAELFTVREIVPRDAGRARQWQDVLEMFGMSFRMYDDADRARVSTHVHVWRLSPDPRPGIDSTYYPLAQLVPLDEAGMPLLFDGLAARSTGIKRWAVLRMDVDHLGRIFREGLGEQPTLARVSTLSFALRTFFEGWLPHLLRRHATIADQLYIQYAGGDDVFIVGAWDAIAEAAIIINSSFRMYVCENPSITLSAGITLAQENFPLYQAARNAGDAEESAKSLVRLDGRAKDAVSFLDVTLGWEKLVEAQGIVRNLCGWDRGKLTSRAFLQTLQQLHDEAGRERTRRAKAGEPKRQYTRANWLAAYQLSRALEVLAVHKRMNTPEVDAAIDGLTALRERLIQPEASTEFIALAARWAQLLLRADSPIPE
jgi:CRISPR-associated protein Csm1